jgi:aminomethyltransferase
MVAFAGWQLPVQYSGVIDEHRAVRGGAGLFDVSHMGEARVRGAGALDFLQHVTCNDVSRLRPGRAHYSGLTNPAGAFVDDLLVYRLDEQDFLLVINAANTCKDIAWLREHVGRFDAELRDESAAWAQLAIQGPRAEEILAPLVEADVAKLRYYRFLQAPVCGARSVVSRTGYTGEDGFEVYTDPQAAPGIWAELLERGAPLGLVPAGLGARDTLRLEARMALYGQDIDDTTTAFEADLGWIVKLDKGEFVGRDALRRQAQAGVERKLVGFEVEGRAIARHGHRAFDGEREVGRVTSGTFSPTLEKSIGLAYLPPALWEPGSAFEVEVRTRRVAARVVETPFYARPKGGK